MDKITNEQIQARTDIINYARWAIVNDALILFEKKANPKTFKFLFEEHGDRLWNHFRLDCDYKFQKFLTYLVQYQKNELIVNCVENEVMYSL